MKKKTLNGETLKERLLASARDRIYNFLLADGAVRGAFALRAPAAAAQHAYAYDAVRDSFVLLAGRPTPATWGQMCG